VLHVFEINIAGYFPSALAPSGHQRVLLSAGDNPAVAAWWRTGTISWAPGLVQRHEFPGRLSPYLAAGLPRSGSAWPPWVEHRTSAPEIERLSDPISHSPLEPSARLTADQCDSAHDLFLTHFDINYLPSTWVGLLLSLSRSAEKLTGFGSARTKTIGSRFLLSHLPGVIVIFRKATCPSSLPCR
jgi:hypothetical protein